MKVLKRSQITEVVTSRSINHRLELNGIEYGRTQNIKSRIPFMDMGITTTDVEVDWYQYTKANCVLKLPKGDVKKMGLEEKFEEIELNEKNGNG